ncbi:hypothetical protein PIB30_091679 [Stylosanthes scabra]|uniref:F-box domain-containing protein n=1 Tax=Stylosanthes scabra TaxID=79078 RepID=A0ABU6ZT87_9FABA|nr:hypothetical protein [Stylosanthes scabra]
MRWTTNPLLPHCGKEHKIAVRNWLDLPDDLTFKIISRLDTFQILTGAQQVCLQWRSICMDPLMWRTINMSNIGIDGSVDCLTLEKMCFRAIDRSCGLLEDIRASPLECFLDINIGDALSIDTFGSNDLLEYIIASKCKLRCLRLILCIDITDEELCELAQKLPLLEELEITICRSIYSSSVAIEAIGRGCPLLKSFKFNHNRGGGNEEAFAIAQNMPNLRHLQLVHNNLDNNGVSAILDGCPLLESLDLTWYSNVKLEGELRRRCDQQLKDFIKPLDTP